MMTSSYGMKHRIAESNIFKTYATLCRVKIVFIGAVHLVFSACKYKGGVFKVRYLPTRQSCSRQFLETNTGIFKFPVLQRMAEKIFGSS